MNASIKQFLKRFGVFGIFFSLYFSFFLLAYLKLDILFFDNVFLFFLLTFACYLGFEISIMKLEFDRSQEDSFRRFLSALPSFLFPFVSILEYSHLKLLPWSLLIGVIGFGIIIIGVIIRFIAICTLGDMFDLYIKIQENHVLITRGIYRFIRHPSYLGLLILILGISVYFSSILGIISAVTIGPLMIIPRIRYEERLLLKKFPKEYKIYSENSWRLIPLIY